MKEVYKETRVNLQEKSWKNSRYNAVSGITREWIFKKIYQGGFWGKKIPLQIPEVMPEAMSDEILEKSLEESKKECLEEYYRILKRSCIMKPSLMDAIDW